MRLRSAFARNLRLLRRTAELSQDQLADLAGLDRNYISKLEREESSPTIDTIEVLALALQVDETVLVSRAFPDVAHDG